MNTPETRSTGVIPGSNSHHTRRIPDPLGIIKPIPSKPIVLKNVRRDADGKLPFPIVLAMQAVDPAGFGAGGHFIAGDDTRAYEIISPQMFADLERVHPTFVRVFGDWLPNDVPAEYQAKPDDRVLKPTEHIELLEKTLRERDLMIERQNDQLARFANRLDALESNATEPRARPEKAPNQKPDRSDGK